MMNDPQITVGGTAVILSPNAPPVAKAAPLAPYFPKSTRIVGTDIAQKALIAIFGPSGEGKSHLGRQLLQSPDYGPDEILFLVNEDVTSIYGDGARVIMLPNEVRSTFEEGQAVVRDLLAQSKAGRRLPKVVVTDSITGFALGTQSYFRAHPIEQINKAGEMARNKFAEFGELGTGMIDYLLLLGQLPCINVVFVTTYENPTKPGSQPEIACEGQMIPKFITQMTTTSLYLRRHSLAFPREAVEAAQVKGTLEQPHRIVCPWQPADKTVTVIDRFLYNQGGGEVITKGHHCLAVMEKADLPAVLRKMMGKGTV